MTHRDHSRVILMVCLPHPVDEIRDPLDVGLIEQAGSLSVARIDERSIRSHGRAEEAIVTVSFGKKHASVPFRLRERVDRTRVIPCTVVRDRCSRNVPFISDHP